jgi:hypothetical protein
MNNFDFWSFLTSIQVSTALVLIAIALVIIVFKIFEGKK